MDTLVPAIDGWFITGDEPALLGGKCSACGTFTFPKRDVMCPNPHCSGLDIVSVVLSRTGTVWSYATNHYPPPPPAVVEAPYTVVAVTLAEEAITVLGLLSSDADPGDLRVGSAVELQVEHLTTDDDGTRRSIWAWKPVAADAEAEVRQ